MLENIKERLIKQIKQEVHNDPLKIYWGLYKNYSYCQGNVYQQEDNIYIIVSSSYDYVQYLKNVGYKVGCTYKPSEYTKGRIIKGEN